MASKLTPELLEKAKQAKTAEDLIVLAKENGTEMTEESAKAYFDQLHKTGELAEDELDNVAGGRKCGTIYKDGWPVVVGSFNTCDLYKRNPDSTDIWGDSTLCDTCTHFSVDGILNVCKNPQRYEN